jgi:hypothetical protein
VIPRDSARLRKTPRDSVRLRKTLEHSARLHETPMDSGVLQKFRRLQQISGDSVDVRGFPEWDLAGVPP